MKPPIVFSISLFINILFLYADNFCSELPYKHFKLTKPNLSIHTLRIDPHCYDILFDTAQIENGYKAQKTSTIAKRNNAIAAINGNFFDLGEPNSLKKKILLLLRHLGINRYHTFSNCIIKNQDTWESLNFFEYAHKSGFIAWNMHNACEVIFDDFTPNWSLLIDDIYTIRINDINKPYSNGPILYNAHYGFTTPVIDGIELIIINNKISAIKKAGNTQIPNNGYIVSIPLKKKNTLQSISINMSAQLSREFLGNFDTSLLKNMTYIVGSYPTLLHNNQIPQEIYSNNNPFYSKKHPRTAIGVTALKQWVFVVVDGRHEKSVGMTMSELAEFMKKIGCKDALNLDGGGSSTMIINEQIVNTPSGDSISTQHAKKERPINSAFLILKK